jgi:hypothetical protein
MVAAPPPLRSPYPAPVFRAACCDGKQDLGARLPELASGGRWDPWAWILQAPWAFTATVPGVTEMCCATDHGHRAVAGG